jgi:serine/threonine-protein kinase
VLRAHKGVGLPVPAVVHLAVSLCEALQYVHERRDANGKELKLVHRDLNPPNILLSKMGEVKLTDFGIARSTSHIQHTEAGTIKGKPGYLAPEQAQSDDFDGRVDLFALGVTLWECTTGEALFSDKDATTTLSNVFEKQVPSLRSRRSETPAAFDAFVRGLLERDVSRRIPSARAALQLLRSIDDGSGARALASAIELAMETTVSSSVGIKAVVATPAHEAATLPGRN